jgi:peptidylprolyl isomerase
MAQAKDGDTVKVHYTGKLKNGELFDKSSENDPLQFKIGEGQIIPGLEEAVIGMEQGETKETEIPADEAYGPRDEEKVVEIERSRFPDNLEPEVDQKLQVQQENGQQLIVTVTDVAEKTVTLDMNHPLAGEDLIFKIELVGIF